MRLRTIPPREPVDTDEKLLRATASIVGCATRREPLLRVYALHETQRMRHRQLTLTGTPRRYDKVLANEVANWVCSNIGDDPEEVSGLIAVWQRRGTERYEPEELVWFRLVGEALRECGVPVRAWLLSHSNGVRWVAVDDLLPPRDDSAFTW